jgi:DNA-binding GntR family transcriptional regulator
MRAYQQIAEMLRVSLRERRLAEGTVLLEGQLAELFGASRAPVRQALEMMTAEGWLSTFDGRGLIVGSPTAKPLRLPITLNDLRGDAGEVTRQRGWEKFYTQVERELIRSSVMGCFRINELELAKYYNVGRTVARDVLVRAERTGIIEKDERNYWLTVPLDERRLWNLYALRALLEPAAIISARRRLSTESIHAMQTRLDIALRAYPNVSTETLDRLEYDLHITCVGQAENPEILDALQRTRCIIISSRHILGSGVALPGADPFINEHLDILSAIEKSDDAAIAETLVAHLLSARDKVTKRLKTFRIDPQISTVPYIETAAEIRIPRGERHLTAKFLLSNSEA